MAPILEDVLTPNLRVVICGSAVGARSAAVGAYYAHPQNRFWRTLHEIGLTPRVVRPTEYRLLPEFGVGLTDMAKHEFGSDTQLSKSAYDPKALRARMLRFRPRALAFNGKRPGEAFAGMKLGAYGRLDIGLNGTAVFILPSTSPAARAFWTIDPWRDFATFLTSE